MFLKFRDARVCFLAAINDDKAPNKRDKCLIPCSGDPWGLEEGPAVKESANVLILE
jgi:hypothetical protein